MDLELFDIKFEWDNPWAKSGPVAEYSDRWRIKFLHTDGSMWRRQYDSIRGIRYRRKFHRDCVALFGFIYPSILKLNKEQWYSLEELLLLKPRSTAACPEEIAAS